MLRASGSRSWCRPLTPQPLPARGSSGDTASQLLPTAQGPQEPLAPLGLSFPSCDTGTVGLALPEDDPGLGEPCGPAKGGSPAPCCQAYPGGGSQGRTESSRQDPGQPPGSLALGRSRELAGCRNRAGSLLEQGTQESVG